MKRPIDTDYLSPFEKDPNLVEIGVGEWVAGKHPKVLMTQALGSCVGVTIWDIHTHIGGLAHIMLPMPADSAVRGDMRRFASVAIPGMVERLRMLGAEPRRLAAKLAGGAAMFRGESGVASIGDRNVAEAKRQLSLLHIPVLAEDTGGSHARTVELHLDTGLLLVRSYRYGIREL